MSHQNIAPGYNKLLQHIKEADDKKCVSEESIQNDKNIIQIKLVF